MTRQEALNVLKAYYLADYRSADLCREYTQASKTLLAEPAGIQWLRHEGGAMPEEARNRMLVSRYDGELGAWFGFGFDNDWDKLQWYYIIPSPPDPLPIWTILTNEDGSWSLRKHGKHVGSGMVSLEQEERSAILDGLNKAAQKKRADKTHN